MVEELPVVKQLSQETEEALNRQRGLLRRMGPVNPEAQAEYSEVKERYEFLTDQVSDLHKAETNVRQVIAELDELMEYEFKQTFEAVALEFHQIFARLFGGGSARLVMTDPDDLTGTGIDIEARLPGRREQGLSLLSGGERSLTAVALVFALLRVSPTPFCVLDEVDAMLDEANVGRFRELLRELSQTTQFVIISHNRRRHIRGDDGARFDQPDSKPKDGGSGSGDEGDLVGRSLVSYFTAAIAAIPEGESARWGCAPARSQ